MAATPTTPDPDDLEPEAEKEVVAAVEPSRRGRATAPRSKLRIVDDWKGMPALLDGERLVTRSASIENLERMKDKAEETGKRPFSTKVAPVAPPEDDDLD